VRRNVLVSLPKAPLAGPTLTLDLGADHGGKRDFASAQLRLLIDWFGHKHWGRFHFYDLKLRPGEPFAQYKARAERFDRFTAALREAELPWTALYIIADQLERKT
jgi:hypothetical protein